MQRHLPIWAALGLAMISTTALAQGDRWGRIADQGTSTTFIQEGSISGPPNDRSAVTISVSRSATDYVGEQTRWSFDCRARTARATGYRDVAADFSTGDFTPSDEPALPIVPESMTSAVSSAVCDGAESDEMHDSLAAAVAAARAP